MVVLYLVSSKDEAEQWFAFAFAFALCGAVQHYGVAVSEPCALFHKNQHKRKYGAFL